MKFSTMAPIIIFSVFFCFLVTGYFKVDIEKIENKNSEKNNLKVPVNRLPKPKPVPKDTNRIDTLAKTRKNPETPETPGSVKQELPKKTDMRYFRRSLNLHKKPLIAEVEEKD